MFTVHGKIYKDPCWSNRFSRCQADETHVFQVCVCMDLRMNACQHLLSVRKHIHWHTAFWSPSATSTLTKHKPLYNDTWYRCTMIKHGQAITLQTCVYVCMQSISLHTARKGSNIVCGKGNGRRDVFSSLSKCVSDGGGDVDQKRAWTSSMRKQRETGEYGTWV